MDNIKVIKIGGHVISNEKKLKIFLKKFSSIKEKKILVHGGGKMATEVAHTFGIKSQIHNGRRITSPEELNVLTMVYAGLINKKIVSLLQSYGCNALGLSGADGNCIIAKKRKKGIIDYGMVGDIVKINTLFLSSLIQKNICPVICSLTHNQKGKLLNTNADTIACEVAKSLSRKYQTSLLFAFEKKGVLLNPLSPKTILKNIHKKTFEDLSNKKAISEGMIPKLHNAFEALSNNVHSIYIIHFEDINKNPNFILCTKIKKD